MALCWPDLTLYDKQLEIMRSVEANDETLVPAGNMLGKDFITALIALWFFCSRSPCRVVTSSSGQTQLKSVLWGEMRRFIQTSAYPLPIQTNDMLIRQVDRDGNVEPRSYIQGIVTNVAENLLGHHLERGVGGRPRTLAIYDEASSIDDEFYNASDTWAHRKLVIGNPLPCTNFFYWGVKHGDQPVEGSTCRFYRKVIRIKAEDSPNVRFALAGKGDDPIIPGVIDIHTYRKRRAMWDPIRQCIGLDGLFYEGAEVLLYPPDWLDRAERVAKGLEGLPRVAKALGCDPGEGGDNTCWSVIDEQGLIYQLSLQTPDTMEIPGRTIDLMRRYKLAPEQVCFDRGGGGKQITDYMRTLGYDVRTTAFGESATQPEIKTVPAWDKKERRELKETNYVYKNRRAEMYGMLRELLNPMRPPDSEWAEFITDGKYYKMPPEFGIPAQYTELRRQLSPIPLLYDPEGRLYLPPKDKKNPESKEKTLKEMLGCSPDEADSLVLACFAMLTKPVKRILGKAMF